MFNYDNLGAIFSAHSKRFKAAYNGGLASHIQRMVVPFLFLHVRQRVIRSLKIYFQSFSRRSFQGMAVGIEAPAVRRAVPCPFSWVET